MKKFEINDSSNKLILSNFRLQIWGKIPDPIYKRKKVNQPFKSTYKKQKKIF